MVVALSRFKVANGCEDAVRDAFLNRPGLVDHAAGFLGLEAFTDTQDASLFYLITRWTDTASFRQWHSGADHKLAHQGIPKGIKLDAAFTQVRTLERIAAPESTIRPDSARDSAALISAFLNRSGGVHWLKARLNGLILASNEALQNELGHGSLQNVAIWPLLTDPDAAALRRAIEEGRKSSSHRLHLNFVGRHQMPFTLDCEMEIQPEWFELIGEPIRDDEQRLQAELMSLNNQLAVQLRENDRQTKTLRQTQARLEKTLADLIESQRHLANLQDVIPICMVCGKVKSAESRWENVVTYLQRSNLALSHGYCPDCFEKEMEQLKR